MLPFRLLPLGIQVNTFICVWPLFTNRGQQIPKVTLLNCLVTPNILHDMKVPMSTTRQKHAEHHQRLLHKKLSRLEVLF